MKQPSMRSIRARTSPTSTETSGTLHASASLTALGEPSCVEVTRIAPAAFSQVGLQFGSDCLGFIQFCLCRIAIRRDLRILLLQGLDFFIRLPVLDQEGQAQAERDNGHRRRVVLSVPVQSADSGDPGDFARDGSGPRIP